MDAMIQQSQEQFNSQIDAIVQQKQAEYNAFVQQCQADCDMAFAARSQAASSQTSSSGLALSICVDNSDVVAQKNAELAAFKAALQAATDSARDNLQTQINSRIQAFRSSKQEEASKQVQNLQEQTSSQLQDFIAAKKTEGNEECEALRASMESELQSKQAAELEKLVETVAKKEPSQIDKFNRKVTDISENTSFLERLKDAVINSGDASAEALINEELNVVLQGAASDFGVDAVNL